MPEQSYHMTPQQFREFGRAAVDWIADYYENIEKLPVLSQVKPGEIRGALTSRSSASARDIRCNSAGHEQSHPAGSYSLAVAKFLRLLSCQCIRTGYSGRPTFFGSGRPRYAVGNESSMHRIGDPCSRLAGSDAGTAGEVPVEQPGWGRDSGHSFEFLVMRHAGGARAHLPTSRATARDAMASLSPTPRTRHTLLSRKRPWSAVSAPTICG